MQKENEEHIIYFNDPVNPIQKLKGEKRNFYSSFPIHKTTSIEKKNIAQMSQNDLFAEHIDSDSSQEENNKADQKFQNPSQKIQSSQLSHNKRGRVENPEEGNELKDQIVKKKIIEKEDTQLEYNSLYILHSEKNSPQKNLEEQKNSKPIINQTILIPMEYFDPKRIKYRVLSSGYNPHEAKQKILKRLGIYFFDEKCMTFDILVMQSFKRTTKFLLALTKGIPIVSSSWLENSAKRNKLMHYKNYYIKDEGSENQYYYDLQGSLEKRIENKHGFLKGYKIWIPLNIKPKFRDIKLLIKESDGEILNEIHKGKNEYCINLMNENDEETQKFLQKGYLVHSIELLFSGILRQEVDKVNFSLNISTTAWPDRL